jgi:uncharacterized protein (DUF305 family)
MTSIRVRIAAALGTLCAVTVVASCSNSSSTDQHAAHSTTTTPSAQTAEAQPGVHNADDVAFARNMLAHHGQAIQLSAMVPTNTANQQLIALAQKITGEQEPEMQAFSVWLLQWGQNPNADHSMPGTMPGMVDQATIDKLQTLNGPDFDKLWLQSMISHHQGAIEMAQAEIAHGRNPDAIGMAKSIITTQQAEIDQMKQMLGG